MNRQEFTRFQDEMDQRLDVRRLDELNPFAAMAGLKRRFNTASFADATGNDALDLWAQTMDVAKHRAQAVTTAGVRAALGSLFSLFAKEARPLFLPEDIYPFYAQAAIENNLSPRTFPTLPQPDFAALKDAAPGSVALLSNPLTPLGRALSECETASLVDWLRQSKDRRLVLDTVYAYRGGFDGATRTLLETDQCFIAHSLSKAWLERGVFGVVIAPENDREKLRGHVEPASKQASAAAFSALRHQADLPRLQQSIFRQKWDKLAPVIRQFDPDFKAPDSGYLALVNAPYEKVLADHNTLLVPASVFGSHKQNLSVASCLERVPAPAAA